jgi:hypothetical protein
MTRTLMPGRAAARRSLPKAAAAGGGAGVPGSWQAFWKLAEAAGGPWADSSGNSHSLTKSNFPTYAQVAGAIGNASRVTVGNTSPAPYTSGTLLGGGRRPGRSSRTCGAARSASASISRTSAAAVSPRQSRSKNGSDVVRVSGRRSNYVEFPLVLDPTVWRHLAVTYNAGASWSTQTA